MDFILHLDTIMLKFDYPRFLPPHSADDQEFNKRFSNFITIKIICIDINAFKE